MVPARRSGICEKELKEAFCCNAKPEELVFASKIHVSKVMFLHPVKATFCGILFGMSITITLGKAGRLVVPKAIRDRLGLREGSRLRLEISGGQIQALPEPDPLSIQTQDELPVIRSGPVLKRGTIVRAVHADRDTPGDRMGARIKRK
jgi:AbrB family looped-hinge helix DNA binding protein